MGAKKETLPRWDLSDLIDKNDPEALDRAVRSAEKTVKEIESFKDKLFGNISVRNFHKLVKLYDEYRIQASKLLQYASMRFDENMSDKGTFEFFQKIDRNLTDFGNRIIFFRLWWKNIDEDNFKRLMSKLSGDHKHEYRCMHFEDILSEVEEKIINIKDLSGLYGLSQLYSVLVSELTFMIKVRGKNKTLSAEEVYQYRFSSNPTLRKNAYEEELKKFGEKNLSISLIYQSIINDHVAEDMKIRGRKKTRLYGDSYNNIQDSLVETMISEIRKNVSVFQHYFVLKAKALGKKKLLRCDVYAPLPKTKAVRYFSFKESSKFILDTFYSFSQEFGDAAKAIFDSRHIDARIFSGKVSGAYCAPVVPKLPSWITIQFNNDIESLQSLAHEAGHGAQFGLSQSRSIGTYEPTIFIGEISSTFAETLVLNRLYEEAQDVATKIFILGIMLDNTYASLIKQGYLAAFENGVIKLAEQNLMTTEAIDNLNLNLCREQFGNSVYVPDRFKNDWTTISHLFQMPLYVYSYAINEEIKLMLFDKYKKRGASFAPKIIKLLSAANSVYPMQGLARAEVNINSPKFSQKVFNIIKKMVDEYETLLNQR